MPRVLRVSYDQNSLVVVEFVFPEIVANIAAPAPAQLVVLNQVMEQNLE